jgi:transcriptional regulator with XRE-family HTH domain
MVEGEIPSWAKALTILRLVRRWNKVRLAQAAGLSNSAISRYEKALRQPKPEEVRRLVAAMGYPPPLWDRALSFVAAAGEAAGASDSAAGSGNADARIDSIAGEAGRWMEELVRDAVTEALAEAHGRTGRPPAPPASGVREVRGPAPIGDALAILRVIRGWERPDLASAVAKPEETLANYEYGKTKPHLGVLQELLSALGFSFAFFEQAVEFVRSAREARRLYLSAAVDALPRQIEKLAAQTARRVEEIARGELNGLVTAVRLLVSRDAAPGSWTALSACPEASRMGLVRQVAEFQTPGFCELLCTESLRAAGDDARRARHLAELAVTTAERAGGTEGFRSRLRGFARAHLANAERVVGDNLPAAGETFECALAEWHAGAADDPGLLNAARVLSLEASLRRAQRRLPEALAALDEGLKVDRWSETPALLLGKARALIELGEFEASVKQLQQAAACIDGKREPRRLYVVEGLFVFCLCRLEQYSAAEKRLPELRELAQHNRLDLLRVDWQEGSIAAGLGRADEALPILMRVRAEFMALNNAYDVALVTLELAEVHAALGHTAEVKALARESAPTFQDQQVHREAQRALALFCRAAEEERVTRELLRSVIAYLYRARYDPHLHFAGQV